MPEFLIREANDEDGPALRAMLTAAWSAYEGCAFEPEDHPPLDHPAERFSEAGGRLWVLLRDGEVAGSLGLHPSARPEEFDLSLICLEEASRGQGFATAMLAGADAFAAASGAGRLGLWVDGRLADGVRFAERRGFIREPGLRGRHDGSDALETRFARAVEAPVVSSRPSEDRPADAV